MSRRKNCSVGIISSPPKGRKKERRDSSRTKERNYWRTLSRRAPFPRIPYRNLHIEFPAWRADLHNLYAFSHPFRIESAETGHCSIRLSLARILLEEVKSEIQRQGSNSSSDRSSSLKCFYTILFLQSFSFPTLNLNDDLDFCRILSINVDNWNFLTFLFLSKNCSKYSREV